MNTLYEQENTEKVVDYRQGLLSVFHRKQKKHLTSISEILDSRKKKWDRRYNFDSNLIATRMDSYIEEDHEVTQLFRELPKPFRLYNWEQMKSLSITHRFCHKLGTDDLDAIALGIKRMKNLKSLNLSFLKCYNINDEGIKKLIYHISHGLLGLKQLALNFEECSHISNSSLASLALELRRNFLDLQSLSLMMLNCVQISDLGVNKLLTALDKYSVKLRKLSLHLTGCNLVTKKALEFFSLGGSKCRHLCNVQQLTLNFSWNMEVDDDCLENLTDGICHYYTNLSSLSLNFSACTKISNKGFLAAGSKTAKSLKQLERLLLNFGGCVKITSQALETVVSDIKICLPEIKHLKIGFVGCLNISSNTKKAIRASLKHIPRLEVS